MITTIERVYIPYQSFQYIELTNGSVTMVDSILFDVVKDVEWYLDSHGYAYSGKLISYLHHLIVGPFNKELCEVHHRNENKLDNRKENLEILTFQQHITRRGLLSNNKTGYIGVSYNKKSGKYRAQISQNNRNVYLGQYKTPKEAAFVYDEQVRILFGLNATTNFKL